MMLANVPAIWIGQHFTKRIPIQWVHALAAITFIVIGVLTLLWG
jgi:putative Ca2+/H+ antiporter (TMEM165/GDT1 family)